MRHILDGIAMVLRDRSLWKYIASPMLGSAGLFLLLWIISYLLVMPGLSGLFSRTGLNEQQANILSSILFFIAAALLSGLLFVTVVSFLSSLVWEKLSLAVEERAMGSAPRGTLSKGDLISDGLSRLLFALLLVPLGFCIGSLFFGVPGILIAGYLALHDFTAPAFLRRGIIFGQQRRMTFKLKDAIPFLLLSGLITLFPFVNVLLLPGLVAGGTLMVARSRDRIGV